MLSVGTGVALLKKRAAYRKHNAVPIFWWQPGYDDKQNFGDKLGPEIIRQLFHIPYDYADIENCDIVSIGSILNVIDDIQEIQGTDRDILVWGSGLIHPGELKISKKLRVCAVRGKLTAKFLHLDREIPLGDPGLLTNLVYPRTQNKEHRILVIPHHSEEDLPIFRKLASAPGQFTIVSPLNEPDEIIRKITSSDIVLSSSLHGLIVADSFGIPNARLKLSNRLSGGDFKFNDYSSAVGREILTLTQRELSESPSSLRRIVKQHFTPIKKLKEIQSKLIRAFPAELL